MKTIPDLSGQSLAWVLGFLGGTPMPQEGIAHRVALWTPPERRIRMSWAVNHGLSKASTITVRQLRGAPLDCGLVIPKEVFSRIDHKFDLMYSRLGAVVFLPCPSRGVKYFAPCDDSTVEGFPQPVIKSESHSLVISASLPCFSRVRIWWPFMWHRSAEALACHTCVHLVSQEPSATF